MVQQQDKTKRKYLHRAQSAEQQEKPPKPSPQYEQGLRQGYQRGKEIGLAEGRQIGFEEGHKHLVALVEEIIMKELGLPSREALVKSGKLPALWIVTLLRYHAEEAGIKRKPAQAGEPSEIAIEPTEDQLKQPGEGIPQ